MFARVDFCTFAVQECYMYLACVIIFRILNAEVLYLFRTCSGNFKTNKSVLFIAVITRCIFMSNICIIYIFCICI